MLDRIRKVIISMITFMLMVSTGFTSTMAASNPLKIHFIDVDNGDSVYIEYNDGSKKYNMLIDGGYYSDYHRDIDTNTDTYKGTYNETYDKYFLKYNGVYHQDKLPAIGKDDNGYAYSDYIVEDNQYDSVLTTIGNSSKYTTKPITDDDNSKESDATQRTADQKLNYIKTQLGKNENACTRYLKKNNITHINYIINTHPHQDHVAGLISVISNSDITYDQIYDNGVNYYSGWEVYFRLIANLNKKYLGDSTGNGTYQYDTIPSQGSKIKLGTSSDAPVFTIVSNVTTDNNFLTNLSSNSSVKTKGSLWDAAINNTSIVMHLKYKNNTFLFTGDSQVAKQNQLIATASVKDLLKVQLLDVAHHGNSNNDYGSISGHSGDHEFYEYIQPQIAIVQCGIYHNGVFKPRPNVIKDLGSAKIYSTKESGNIVVGSNGNTISIESLSKGQTHHFIENKKVNNGYHKDGYIEYICDGCAAVYKTEILAQTHQYHHDGVIVEANHFQAGQNGQYCECGLLLGTYDVAQQAHVASGNRTIVKPTVTTGGIGETYCSCGAVLGQYAINRVASKSLYKGKKVTLQSGVSGKVTWTSSKKSVATVNSKGVVTAKKVGKTTITLKQGKKKLATCVITVKGPTLNVSRTSVTLKKGKSMNVSASASPSATVTWSSSNKKVATVSKGKITAKKKGTCTITAKANGISRKIKVKVK